MKTSLLFNFEIILILISFTSVISQTFEYIQDQLSENDKCFLTENPKVFGKCTKITECKHEYDKYLREEGVLKICAFGKVHVDDFVCCSIDEDDTRTSEVDTNDNTIKVGDSDSTTNSTAATAHEFRVYNNCPFTMWPGLLGNTGKSTPMNGGFQLDSYNVKVFSVEKGWTGRIWARRDCDGSGYCFSGDCGNKIECNGLAGKPPATLAQFSLDGDNGLDYYDISLVDGYNLPMRITPIDETFTITEGGDYDCKPAGCFKDLNPDCPEDLSVWSGEWKVACKSACGHFNTDEYCCRGDYATPDTCLPDTWPQNYVPIFKAACPTAYGYAFDGETSTFTCKGNPVAGYTVTFCP